MATTDLEAIKAKIKDLAKSKKYQDARDFLDKAIVQYPDSKSGVEALYTKEILKGNVLKAYSLDYDSFGEGLEPIYYWVLDMLRHPVYFGYTVEKTADYFAAAEASYWYGDVGMRRTALEKRATELLGTINIVVKSIINLLWDLKEFAMRLKNYADLKKGGDAAKTAELALKAVFLSEVDIKKGRGALNMLAQELNFITIRDAFMAAKDAESVDKMDLNERVKRVLKPRVQEYFDWVKLSERELTERYRIEKAYLKSQVNALELYTKWTRPYLIATNKLMPPKPEDVTEAEEIVSAFNVSRIYIEIFGRKEQKLNVTEATGSWPISLPDEERVFRCVEVIFLYRSSPETVERGHFIHRGKVRMTFNAYALQKKHLDLLGKANRDELMHFVSGMTDETLKAMDDDLKKYLGEGEESGKKEKKRRALPIAETARGILRPFKEAAEGIKGMLPPPKKKMDAWGLARVLKEAQEKAGKDALKLYDTYKKMHGMYTPP